MKKMTLVYDWPTRIFHWLFALLFIGAFTIAKTFDDDSAIYPYHMLAGLTLVVLIVLRMFWGLFGSYYAQFKNFDLNPVNLVQYLKDVFLKNGTRRLGHNPASSWAAVVMMILVLGLAITGYMITQKIAKETVEEIHEIFSNLFVILVIFHIAGIIVHTLKHKDQIGLSMVHGFKQDVANQKGIAKSHALVGVLFLFLTVGFGYYIYHNYDTTEQSLKFMGQSLQLGENQSVRSNQSDDERDED